MSKAAATDRPLNAVGWLLLVSLALTGGCSFYRVPFIYSNLAHMNYHDAMTTISEEPEQFVFDMSEAFRRNGATVLKRSKEDFILVEDPDGLKCWEANYEIFQKEFASFRSNSYTTFQSIDRLTPFVSRKIKNDCSIFKNMCVAGADSWFLLVELPAKSSQSIVYQPTIENFFFFNQNRAQQGFSTTYAPEQVNISIATRLYIWAWKRIDSESTSIYMLGKPISGEIEADAGNSIGYDWWRISNGYTEQQLIRNYIAMIQEYDRKKRQH